MNRRTILQAFIAAALAPLSAFARHGRGVGAAGGVPVPNIAALPLGDNSIGDWNNGGGPTNSSWAINSRWQDTTGAWLTRVSNATHIGLDAQTTTTDFGNEYASNGPLISRPFGTNLDTYHIIGYDWGGGIVYVFDYQIGVGALAGTKKTIPIGNSEALCQAFSTNPNDSAHIMYISDRAAGNSVIHRYDIQAQAYATNSIFTGGTASYATSQDTAGWLQTNWSGSHLTFAAPFGGGGNFCSLDLNTGVLTTTTSASTNEMKIGKGATKVATLCGGTAGEKFWFIGSNHLTAAVVSGAYSTQTHSNMGESKFYIFNGDAANFALQVFDLGTDPGSNGGTWNGTESDKYTVSGSQTLDSDEHPQMGWNQTGAGTSEWFCFSVCNGSGSQSLVSANAWSVDSGSIYKTSVSYGSGHYDNSVRGVTAVRILTGANITGKLNKVASYGALVAGTFFFDVNNTHGGGAGVLYAWMPGGVTPVSVTELLAQPVLGESLGYAKQDGSERRRLCYTYRREIYNGSSYRYSGDCYANWSPDGRIATFKSNWGIPGGRTDMVVVEVPHT